MKDQDRKDLMDLMANLKQQLKSIDSATTALQYKIFEIEDRLITEVEADAWKIIGQNIWNAQVHNYIGGY
jgi:hypothetical protein